jgi:excisionase family DNA binding protein
MKKLLSTKEVAQFLNVNEKMVYTLVADKGLPAAKITGKWLFPRHLVEQWVETATINYPDVNDPLPPYDGLLILAGSNDLLLDKAIGLFNDRFSEHIAVMGNLGSMGGLNALRHRKCHIAASHLLHDEGQEYNFNYISKQMRPAPAIVNFCYREQGMVIQKNNPKAIQSIEDLAQPGVRMVNRPLGTGTRLLLDHGLKQHGISAKQINGYDREMKRHLEVGLEVLAGRADAGPAIRPVATLLDLGFIPLRWERFDLVINKSRFFDKGVQLFLGLLKDETLAALSAQLGGYRLEKSGEMVFPQETENETTGNEE